MIRFSFSIFINNIYLQLCSPLLHQYHATRCIHNYYHRARARVCVGGLSERSAPSSGKSRALEPRDVQLCRTGYP